MKKISIPEGERFGLWVSLGDAKSRHGNAHTRCRCDCGVIKSVNSGHLRNGKTKSCGCGKARSAGLSRRIDISGQRFGMLIAKRRIRDPKTGYWTNWKCRCDCGKAKVVSTGSLRGGKQKSCGCLPRGGEHSGRWKGGRIKTAAGYIRVWNPEHNRANSIGYVLEHIAVMQDKLGRPLFESEQVHHKNSIKDDNRPENLELWTKSQPSGARVEDMIEFCIEFLERYGEIDGRKRAG